MRRRFWLLVLALLSVGGGTVVALQLASTHAGTPTETTQQRIEKLRRETKAHDKSPGAHLDLGIALSDAGRWDEARGEFREVLKLRPEDAVAIYNLGLTNLRDAQTAGPSSPDYYQLLDHARALLLQAAQLNPKLPHLHAHLGYLNHTAGDQEGTIAEYTKEVEAYPLSADAHNNLGSALGDVERYSEALLEYMQALALDPVSTSVLMNLQGAVRRGGKAADFLVQTKSLLKQSPDSLVNILQYALALYLNGKNEEALQQFDRALRRNQALAAAHFLKAEILRENNSPAKSAEEYSIAARLSPERADFATRQAAELVKAGKLQQAEAILRRSIARAPRDSMLHFQLARVLQRSSQKASAAKEFAISSKLKRKEQVEGMVVMDLLEGIGLLRADKAEEAANKFQEAQTLDPELAEASFYLGIAFSKLGDTEASTRAFEGAIRKRPSSAEIHYNFGIALWQEQQISRAIAEFRKAIYFRPDYGLARCALGLALLRAGKTVDGKAEVERSRKLGACQTAAGGKESGAK